MADFRKMRRARQEMTKEECLEILERCSEGVLSLLGDDNFMKMESYIFTVQRQVIR